MPKEVKFFLLLFFPSLIFGQDFKLINSVQIDTFDNATLSYQGLDFVALSNLKKGTFKSMLIANVDGTDIRPAKFDGVSVKQFSKNLRAPAKKTEKYGFVNRKGEIIIPIEYDYIGKQFVDGQVLGKKKGEWFFIDTLNQATPFPDSNNYKTLDIVSSKTILAMNDWREYTFLNFEGKSLFEKKFSYVQPNRFHDYLFNVSSGKMRGIISSKTGMIVPFDRENIPNIKENYIVNEHRSRSDSHFWDLEGKPIDTKNKTIVKPAGELGFIFREVEGEKKMYGLCDHDFKTTFPAEFKKYYILRYGYVQLFYPDNSSIVINKLGEIILPKDRFQIFVLSPDDLVIKKTKRVNGKRADEIAWLDGNGKTILPPPIMTTMGTSPIYGEKQSERVHTILGVQQKDTTDVAKYHLYDRTAKLLNVIDYDSVYYFTPSLLLVMKNKKQGLINDRGKLVLPIVYKNIAPMYNRMNNEGSLSSFLRLVTPDGKMGLADFEGNLVFLTDEKVRQIHWVQEKYLWVVKGNEYQVFEWQR